MLPFPPALIERNLFSVEANIEDPLSSGQYIYFNYIMFLISAMNRKDFFPQSRRVKFPNTRSKEGP